MAGGIRETEGRLAQDRTERRGEQRRELRAAGERGSKDEWGGGRAGDDLG